MGFQWLEKVVELDNIAPLLDEQKLSDIGGIVYDGYTEDKESRAGWEVKQESYMTLALQGMEVKNTPWPNDANVKYPLLTTATMQFGARSYPGLVGSANVAKGKVTGFDQTGEKAKSAQRIGLHMSYQLLDEMEEWEDDMDRLCISIPIVGCMFKKSYLSSR